MNPRHWKQLNSMPKEFKAKTTELLRQIYKDIVGAEKRTNIRSEEEAAEMAKNFVEADELQKMEKDGVIFGTVNGDGYYDLKGIEKGAARYLMFYEIKDITRIFTYWDAANKKWLQFSTLQAFS